MVLPVLFLTILTSGCSIPRWPVQGTLTSPYGIRFLGMRPDLHRGVDIQVPDGTEVLAGVINDWSDGSRLFNLEASRRLGNDWNLGVQARLWHNIDDDAPEYGLRRDDYLELKLTRYF